MFTIIYKVNYFLILFAQLHGLLSHLLKMGIFGIRDRRVFLDKFPEDSRQNIKVTESLLWIGNVDSLQPAYK